MSTDQKTMELRPYMRPRIFRVALNHEQAVLSQCQLNFKDMRNNQPGAFCETGRRACRKQINARGYDSTSNS